MKTYDNDEILEHVAETYELLELMEILGVDYIDVLDLLEVHVLEFKDRFEAEMRELDE